MFFLFNAVSYDNSDIAARVKRAAEDEQAFAQLSKDFEKHNRFVASQVTGRFITESDDEWSVTLIAFYEAVRSYRPDRGSFTAFSDMVIKRRLIDQIRHKTRTAREVSVDMSSQEYDNDEETRYEPAAGEISRQAMDNSARAQESRDIRWEIEGLNKVLAGYGVAFHDLPDVSPKAEKTKTSCAKAIAAICENDALYQKMKQNGRLPAKEVSKASEIPLKLLDKHRKYIIAVVEIIKGDYPSLQAYTAAIKIK